MKFKFEQRPGLKLADPNQLELNDKNPRTITDEDFDKLVKSIKRNPSYLYTLTIKVKDGLVVCGNQRLKACRKIGYKEIPYLDLSEYSEEEIKDIIIKDNKHAGEFDLESFVAFSDYWTPEILAANDINLNSEPLIITDDSFLDREGKDYDPSQLLITVDCDSETEQKQLYEELINRGYQCKLIG